MNKHEMNRKTSKSNNSPQYVMKSTLGEGFDDGDNSGQTELNSNFSDIKPSRPCFYKKEFKKLRESLQLDGEVKIALKGGFKEFLNEYMTCSQSRFM